MSPMRSTSYASGADTGSETPPVLPKNTIDKNVFLQLLVAQLRNQNPLNPTDGTQFVTQLAQFQQLEQSLNTGQDVAAIRDAVTAEPTKPTTTQP